MHREKDLLQGGISFEEIYFYDLSVSMFDCFHRHQEIRWCWRKKSGRWILENTPGMIEWDRADIQSLVDRLRLTLSSSGIVLGAFNGAYLIGFASIEVESFGPYYEYVLLSNLYVSYEYRRKGVGKKLFQMAGQAARGQGAQKLYISAPPCEETQAFFQSMRCVEAAYCRGELLAAEPLCRQMECVL